MVIKIAVYLGRKANRANLPYTANPYAWGSVEFFDWEYGWCDM